MIPTIGIVGGIGSGKSAVAETMRQLGGYLISADQLGHEALRQPDIRAKVIDRWGDGILHADGAVDRRKLGAIVFADANERHALEQLVFPYIEKRIVEEIASARTRLDVKFIILDAAILVESGWHKNCSKIVFVDSPRPTRLERLREKRGWSSEEVERREKAQMPLDEKKSRADAVIVNDEGLEKVSRQVQESLERRNVI